MIKNEPTRVCHFKTCRMRLIAESEEGADIPEEIEEIDDDEPEPETLKYANRSGSYSLCSRAGLGLWIFNNFYGRISLTLFFADPLAKRFGLTPEHFAENLRDNYQRHEVDQEHIEPAEAAKEYLSR